MMIRRLFLLAMVIFTAALYGCGGGSGGSGGTGGPGDGPAPIVSLSYGVTTVLYLQNQEIVPNTPYSSGATITSYSIKPELPAGLTLDASSGVISGKPTVFSEQITYAVTGNYSTGSVTTGLRIGVAPPLTPLTPPIVTPPAISLNYDSSNIMYLSGQTIADNRPHPVGGDVTSYSISATLPAGLTFNTQTGIISGKPIAISAATEYTVTGSNSAGSSGFEILTIGVSPVLARPATLRYVHMSAEYGLSEAVVPNTPISTGGPIQEYAISTPLPSGMTFSKETGDISGTPTVVSPVTAYTIIGSNAAGQASATIHISVVARGVWSAAAPLLTARTQFTATVLPDGKVLVAGGYDASRKMVNTAELYDPDADTWVATANPMEFPRAGATAVLLPDSGKVLVIGSKPTGGGQSSSELYDPATQTWSTASLLNGARINPTADVLAGDRVLLVGGSSSTNTAELYDAGSNTWTTTTASILVTNQNGVTLQDGSGLLIGGQTASLATAGVSSFSLQGLIGVWTPNQPMNTARYDFAAVRLPSSGQVVVAGGYSGASALNSIEMSDPTGNGWAPQTSLLTARIKPLSVSLPGGKVLIAGGYTAYTLLPQTQSVEVYDSTQNQVQATGTMGNKHTEGSMVYLPNSGNVLVIGGQNGSSSGTGSSGTELYIP